MYLWTAFTIGLFGSLHCVGMCGPVALAVGGKERGQVVINGLLYNLGRTLTYTLLGGVIGLLGKGLFLAGFQKYLSIGIGVALLAIALFSINVETKILKITAFHQLVFKLKSGIGKWIRHQSRVGTFAVGVMNGLLPCGLVYMAVVGALSTAGWLSGMAAARGTAIWATAEPLPAPALTEADRTEPLLLMQSDGLDRDQLNWLGIAWFRETYGIWT